MNTHLSVTWLYITFTYLVGYLFLFTFWYFLYISFVLLQLQNNCIECNSRNTCGMNLVVLQIVLPEKSPFQLFIFIMHLFFYDVFIFYYNRSFNLFHNILL